MTPPPEIAVIVPARNEAALIGPVLDAALAACALANRPAEVIVVDCDSDDGTDALVRGYAARGVRLLRCAQRLAPAARNLGARRTDAALLVFVDADTLMPPDTLARCADHAANGALAGFAALAAWEPGRRARLWWGFWNQVRRLPLARAKAMPALMFCTSAAFERFGPFDERVKIGEEWPILAGVYRAAPHRLVYDRALRARSSSRRMDLQPWGYSRTLLKYAWAILHVSGRVAYTDRHRHPRAVRP